MKHLAHPILTNEELLNRDFKLPADRWYHIAPIGTFPHPSGCFQVIDKEACDAMANRFASESAEPNFPGLLIDFDHHSNDPSLPTTAAGWITHLENRKDGLWAQVRWSDLGEQSLTGGRFRLTSPVWNRSDCDQWKSDDDQGTEQLFVRPRRLDRVALTNDPNMPGMKPLSNRADEVTPDFVEDEIGNRRAATRDELLNYGTSAGAKKGWETRRSGMAQKSELKKVVGKGAISDEAHAANLAKANLKQGARAKLREKAQNETYSTGPKAEQRFRELVAKKAATSSAAPAATKTGAEEPRAATKGDLAIHLPAKPAETSPTAATKEESAAPSPRVATKADLAAKMPKKGFFAAIKEAFAPRSAAHDED